MSLETLRYLVERALEMLLVRPESGLSVSETALL